MPWSTEFMEAYAAAMSEAPVVIGAKRTVPGTVAEAVGLYLASRALAALARTGRKPCAAPSCNGFETSMATSAFAMMEPDHVARLISKLRPYAQRNMRKTLRGLVASRSAPGLSVDPSANVKLVPVKDSGGFKTWPVDVEQYRARHKLGTRPRLALELLYGTATAR